MKNYLHKPIKVLQFVSCRKIQQYLELLRNMLPFSTITHVQTDSRILQEIFLHVIPVRMIVPCSEGTHSCLQAC